MLKHLNKILFYYEEILFRVIFRTNKNNNEILGLFNGYNFDFNSTTNTNNASLLQSGVPLQAQPAQSPLISTSNNSNSKDIASQYGNVVYNHTTQSLSSSMEKLD